MNCSDSISNSARPLLSRSLRHVGLSGKTGQIRSHVATAMHTALWTETHS